MDSSSTSRTLDRSAKGSHVMLLILLRRPTLLSTGRARTRVRRDSFIGGSKRGVMRAGANRVQRLSCPRPLIADNGINLT